MEAGDGRRAQTVYLKPKKKVPAPVLEILAPLPTPTFPQVRLHSCPAGSPRARQTAASGFPEEPSWVSLPSQPAEAAWEVLKASESKAGVYQRGTASPASRSKAVLCPVWPLYQCDWLAHGQAGCPSQRKENMAGCAVKLFLLFSCYCGYSQRQYAQLALYESTSQRMTNHLFQEAFPDAPPLRELLVHFLQPSICLSACDSHTSG